MELQKSIEQKELQRKQNQLTTSLRVKEVLNAKYLHNIIEERYHETVEIPELELKKKQLEELRSFLRQPLDASELKNHKRRYEELKMRKMEEIERHRELTLQ